ncbi:hypothetical protein [Zobellella aerophila]|uniref:Uncharacterized protein n=1 Tax=Zobellella aerophila TaxID=870480 RepID=A0ABP6VXB8_9GAMM
MSRALHKTLTPPVVEYLLALAPVEQLDPGCDRYIQPELLHSRQGIITAEREYSRLSQLCRQRRKFEAAALLKPHIESAGQSIKQPLNSR